MQDFTQLDPDAQSRRRIAARFVLGLSVPVYLGSALAIVVWLPGYAVLTSVPVLLAAHSAAYLLSGKIDK